MTKNPYLNALFAGLYIVIIVLFFNFGTTFLSTKSDTILTPMAMLSLLVLSVAFMSYAFFLQPMLMFVDGHKREAIEFFTKTLVTFAAITVIILAAAFTI
jgi:hypothetical protein